MSTPPFNGGVLFEYTPRRGPSKEVVREPECPSRELGREADVTGGCLCGAVRFAAEGPATPIELCHCGRCKRAYGSAFAATLYVKTATFRWSHGEDHVATYDAPIVRAPPPYRHVFCRVCGSPLPIVRSETGLAEIPAGTLDADPGTRPIRHIYTRAKAAWFEIADRLPQHDEHAEASEWLRTMLAGWPDG
jgi:hypothetical protein